MRIKETFQDMLVILVTMVTLVTVVCEDAQMNKMLKIMVTLVTEVTLNQIANLRRCVRNIPRHARAVPLRRIKVKNMSYSKMWYLKNIC